MNQQYVVTWHDEAPSGWDDWLKRQGNGADFLQSTTWGHVLSTAHRTRVHYVTIETAGTLCGSALLYEPWQGAGGIRRLADSLGRSPRCRRLTCSGGPTLTTNGRAQALEALLRSIHERVGSRPSRILFNGFPALSEANSDKTLETVYANYSYRGTDWATCVIDITLSDDQLLKSFDRSVRKGLNHATAKGLSVAECHARDEYENDFVGPFVAARSNGRDRAVLHRTMIAHWLPAPHDSYRFFVCRDKNGNTLAVLATYRFNGMATEIMSARTGAGSKDDSHAQDYLHWEIMRAHRQDGDHFFDLAGFNPYPVSDKEAGIKRFKTKWGGTTLTVKHWEYRVPTIVQRLASLMGATRGD